MNTMTLRALLLLAPLALAACSSAPTRYYTLIPSGAPATQAPMATSAFQFEMLPVRMPVQVDQPQLVVRQDQGSLAVLENSRWGAPLADEFHDALVGQLEQQLGARDLAGLPKQAGKPLLSLRTDVRRFDSMPGQYALVDVVWSLSLRNEGAARRSLTCSTVLREPAGVGLESLVLAHQQAIGQLANTIAGTAKAWAPGGSVGCP